MLMEEILSHPPQVLHEDQRLSYFRDGYLLLPGFIDNGWIDDLNAELEKFIEASRDIDQSTDNILIEGGHTRSHPRLLRVNQIVDHSQVFWNFATESVLPDIACDLVGPDVKFRESTVNFKWAGGGTEIAWHQDIAFMPHTNLNLFNALVYLDDVEIDQGPLQVIPGSHKGEIFRHYDSAGNWIARVADKDLESLGADKAVSLTGSAGTLVLLHCGTAHYSAENISTKGRPLVFLGYQAADSFCYIPFPRAPKSQGYIVRGRPSRYAQHDPVSLPMPPDWSDGYGSIYEDQKRKELDS